MFAQPEAAPHLDRPFLHFTSPAAAASIVADRELRLSATIVNAIYAVAVGSVPVPGVQHDRSAGRAVAVMFRTAEAPSTWFPEEVIWRATAPMPIDVVDVLDAEDADQLLDSTLVIPDDGWWHTRTCGCAQCVIAAAARAAA